MGGPRVGREWAQSAGNGGKGERSVVFTTVWRLAVDMHVSVVWRVVRAWYERGAGVIRTAHGVMSSRHRTGRRPALRRPRHAPGTRMVTRMYKNGTRPA